MTYRLNDQWASNTGQTYTYSNDRITNYGWSYDADGRVIATGAPEDPGTTTYDAAGKILLDTFTTDSKITHSYDGNGLETKRIAERWHSSNSTWVNDTMRPTTYFIRSTVLGGQTVTEVNPSRTRTYVLANGGTVATQIRASTNSLYFSHPDALGSSITHSKPDGSTTRDWVPKSEFSSKEFDPQNGNTGAESPYIDGTSIPEFVAPLHTEDASNINPNDTVCTADGLKEACSKVYHMLERGTAARCPNDYCGPAVYDNHHDPPTVTPPWIAHADGTSGYKVPKWSQHTFKMEGDTSPTNLGGEIIAWKFVESGGGGDDVLQHQGTSRCPPWDALSEAQKKAIDSAIYAKLTDSGKAMFLNATAAMTEAGVDYKKTGVRPAILRYSVKCSRIAGLTLILQKGLTQLIKLAFLVADRTRVIGFNETQKRIILDSLIFMVIIKKCADEFKKAGLATPAETLRDRGVTFANYDLLHSSSNNDLLGISETERRTIISSENLNSQGVTIFDFQRPNQNSLNYPVFTFFKQNSFGGGDFPTDEVMVHERIHGSGVEKNYSLWSYLFPFYGHDLSGYKHYDAIMNACRIGTTP